MSQKLVSVIIPVFNSVLFIEETINSVFNQTYPNLEVILIDDGSTDGSLNYLKNLNKGNVTIMQNSRNGACAARNYGYKLSNGHYIQFLDADDILSPNKIELQVCALENNPNSIAVCNTMHFYDTIDNGVVTDWDFLYTTSNTEKFLLNLYGANGKTNMVQTSAWLSPKYLLDKVGLWDETLTKDQDGEYFCRAVAQADQVIYVPETMNYYRKHIHGSNIANQRQRHAVESQFRALNSKANHFKKLKHTASFKNAMALQYKIVAIDAYPHFKDISNKAIAKVHKYGGSNYEPVLGGKIIEAIKSIFGWRAA
ncbi:MAG: glycosyltransferase family 2 protein, partial [Saprospiraceae bacterium]